MSVFEQLRPFVSLCQACGMIPFTMVQNSISNKFVKFTFSFRQFTVWWFVMIFLLQLVVLIFMAKLSLRMQDAMLTDRNIPITLTIMGGITMFSYSAQLILARWVVLRYRKLRNAIEAVQEVERLFGDKFIEQHQCSVVNRFAIAFILIVTMGTVSFFLFVPVYQQFSPADMNILLTAAIYFILSMLYVMNESTFLLIHISYYVITHYLKLLFLNSDKRNTNELPMASGKGTENIKELRRNALIFDYLCQASSQLNDIFSVPVLFVLILKFLTVISTAFVFFYRFTYSNVILENSKFIPPLIFILEWIRMLIIFTAADMPVIQVHLLRERLCAWSHSRLSKTLAENIAELAILLQINEDRIRMSAAGLFKVGKHLIPALTGAVVTYMVILLQN